MTPQDHDRILEALAELVHAGCEFLRAPDGEDARARFVRWLNLGRVRVGSSRMREVEDGA